MGLTKTLLEDNIQSWEQLDHVMEMVFAEQEQYINLLKQNNEKENDQVHAESESTD